MMEESFRRMAARDRMVDGTPTSLVDLGYTTSQLLDVPQDGCKYEGAFLKE